MSVFVDLPGMHKEDINVSINQNLLVVQGEKKECPTMKGHTFLRNERSYGKIHRSFRLPANADTSNSTCAYVDGVLQITFPKLASATNFKKIVIT